MLIEDLDDKELALKEHSEFQDVHEDDLAGLADFRDVLGLGPSNIVENEASFDRGENESNQASNQLSQSSQIHNNNNNDQDDDEPSNYQDNTQPSLPTYSQQLGQNSRASSIGGLSQISSTKDSLSSFHEDRTEQNDMDKLSYSGKKHNIHEAMSSDLNGTDNANKSTKRRKGAI